MNEPDDDHRAQIEPLAKIAYRFHELSTQVAYLARNEAAGLYGPCVQETCIGSLAVHTLASCGHALMAQAEWARERAIDIRDTVKDVMSNRFRGPDDDEQWWIDLTARPIESKHREAVIAVKTPNELAALLVTLADESDRAHDALDETCAGSGSSCMIATNARYVGAEIRDRAARLNQCASIPE
ncbi:Uncharacterised protein [Mycobacteroides abscessus subsp. abscessus]|uniref:hypothetical protein n=1 Tax=Mycobacteroides abscessus TaxID=36809 RepID=UPI0009A5D1AA|nr:hypothetical protein [Mycobacteroides abscessus]SLI19801.1 Uncharacterised protein [Mycobacteroides abscessus subsp. abscessus]